MRFSILTPSFNQGAFLEKNIRSVKQQDVAADQIEHIIMDGGSTDGTVEVLKKYGDGLAYWVSEADGGQSDALAKALARATGDIIGWINVDEFYEPGIFRAVSDAFEQNPDAVLVYGNFRRVTPDGKTIRVNRQWRFDYDVCRTVTPTAANCAAFFRRDRLIDVGGFDSSWECIMDWEMFIRLMRGPKSWVRLDRVLGNFTMHRQSKTAMIQPKFAAEMKRLRQREFPELDDAAFDRMKRTQIRRMKRHMLLDGVIFEKVWFKLARQRHFAAYFGDSGVRLPVFSRLLDMLSPPRID